MAISVEYNMTMVSAGNGTGNEIIVEELEFTPAADDLILISIGGEGNNPNPNTFVCEFEFQGGSTADATLIARDYGHLVGNSGNSDKCQITVFGYVWQSGQTFNTLRITHNRKKLVGLTVLRGAEVSSFPSVDWVTNQSATSFLSDLDETQVNDVPVSGTRSSLTTGDLHWTWNETNFGTEAAVFMAFSHRNEAEYAPAYPDNDSADWTGNTLQAISMSSGYQVRPVSTPGTQYQVRWDRTGNAVHRFAVLAIGIPAASAATLTTIVTGSYSVQNSDSVQGDYGVQTSSPVTASYSVQVSTPVTASYSVEVSAPVSGSYSVQASASVSASYSVEVSTEVTASYSVQVSTPVSSSYSVQVSTPVSADYFVETTPTAQVAADYGVQSSTNVQSDYGVRVEKSVSSSYDVQSSAAESTQVSASYALQVSDDVQADYGVKVSSEVAASYGLQLSPDVTAGYSVQRILSDQVDSDYAVRNSSPVSASYSLTFSRDVLGDYAVQSESTVQSDYAIANSTEIGASYVVDDGITNASVTLLDSIPIQSVGTAQTTLSFSAIGQSQFAGQSLVIALVGVGEFRNSSNQNWNVNYPFFSHSPSMDEVTNTLSTNTTAPEFVKTSFNPSLSEDFCYLAYRQIQASDTFKTYDVTVDIPYNSTGNFVGGVLLRVNNGVVPSSWPKHRHQTSLIQGISYTTPAQNYDANSLILTLVGFHDDESGGVVTPEKGIEELYQSNVVNKGGQTSPRGLIAEEPVGNSALTNRSQVFTLPTGLAPPLVQILSFNFEIQAGETQTQQVSAEYVVQGASTTSVITGSYGVGGTDTATATYSVQSTDTVAVGSDYAVKPEAAVSADYAVTTSDQVAGDYALQVQQPVSGSYGVTNSEEVDGDYAVLNSRIVTSNYLVATENVEFASVTASYGVTAETEVSGTYGVGQSAQVDADYAVMNEPSVSADYGVQVQSPVSASYALQATESVGATFSVQNTQAVESDYAVKNSEQVTGEYLVQQLDVQGQVSASYDVGVPQIRNIGASYAVSGQITVNQETVLGEYVVRNDAYVAEKALRQLGYLKQRTK